ncbi:MAG: hypothetical protein FJ220_00145 [Kiritimatiellaceae bacterium]|nr:hypothetical protein [Kiritimatiellaceae bacterium]
MKTQKLEQWLLLEQSGELSSRQAKKLARVLSTSSEARKLRDELKLVCGAVRPIDEELSPWTVTKIASRLRQEERAYPLTLRAIKPLLAGIACLMVMVSLLNFHEQSTSQSPIIASAATAGVDVWSDPFDEELSNLGNLIASLSDHPFDPMEM